MGQRERDSRVRRDAEHREIRRDQKSDEDQVWSGCFQILTPALLY